MTHVLNVVNNICEIANELTVHEKERILRAIMCSCFGREKTADGKQTVKQFIDIAAFFKVQEWLEKVGVKE